METLKLSIPNMKCLGCQTRVEGYLKKIGGVTDVQTDTDAKMAVVTYSGDKTIKNLILNTLSGIGYPGEIIE